MADEVVACFQRILKDRVNPKVEPMVDGMTGFLFLDKNDMPMVALHWEKYFKHIRYYGIYARKRENDKKLNLAIAKE